MNIWNKVFLGLIFVLAIAVAALASVEFQIRNKGLKTVNKLETNITDTEAAIAKILSGLDSLKFLSDKQPSNLSFEEIRRLASERFHERGIAWFDCIVASAIETTLPADPDAKLVEAEVIITSPFVTRETDGTTGDAIPLETLNGVVYVFEVFESKDDRGNIDVLKAGQFLGRFIVEEVTTTKFDDEEENKSGLRVKLITADYLSADEIDQIFDSVESRETRWAIYTTPPMDRVAGVFDKLTDEEKEMFPPELLEYFKPRPMPELTEEEIERIDGLDINDLETGNIDAKTAELLKRAVAILEQDQTAMDSTLQRLRNDVIEKWKQYRATTDNPDATIDDPDASLPQDYAARLNWLYQQRSSLLRAIKDSESVIEMYHAATDQAKAEGNKLEEQDIPLETKRVSAMEAQRDVVGELLKQYKDEIASIALQIEKLKTQSKEYVDGITEAQLNAAEKIEERAKDMAQVQEDEKE